MSLILKDQETGKLYDRDEQVKETNYSQMSDADLNVTQLMHCMAGEEIPNELKGELKSRGYL